MRLSNEDCLKRLIKYAEEHGLIEVEQTLKENYFALLGERELYLNTSHMKVLILLLYLRAYAEPVYSFKFDPQQGQKPNKKFWDFINDVFGRESTFRARFNEMKKNDFLVYSPVDGAYAASPLIAFAVWAYFQNSKIDIPILRYELYRIPDAIKKMKYIYNMIEKSRNTINREKLIAFIALLLKDDTRKKAIELGIPPDDISWILRS